ncbi:hypothetical protein [Pedobacter sp. D749]|uniref:hypothetical protein n=1 Tax=Pedobacter sp. D749 TaxID=2856523 RepID=UPI001C565CC1|nr:hypothetical protein [Pedobacter sp. D749]QXU39807.1 hypothetical protein KYH19_12285 [Pedobacter sp. D749]
MKTTSLLPLVLCLFACKPNVTKQQQAEVLVKKYLDSTLNDPKSYEAISFEKLDSTYTSFKYSSESEVYNKKIDSLNDVLSIIDSKISTYTMAQLKQAQVDDKRISKQVEEILDAKAKAALKYKGDFTGYSIIHYYRAKNGFNAIIKTSNTFMIDSTLTKVWDVKK